MADFVLKGKALLSDIDISSTVRNKLRNLKITLNASAALSSLTAMAKATAIVTSSIQKLNTSLAQVAQQGRGVNTVTAGFQRASQQAKAAAAAGRTFSDELTNIARRAFGFRLATIAINSTVNSLKDAAKFLANFDAELIDIQKTTGVAGKQLQDLGTDIIKVAANYGIAAEEVAASFKTIIQAGFEADRAIKFASKAAEGASATTLDFAQATDLVIQVARQFGEAHVETIFDKISVAEDETAVSAIDLKDAFARTGETLRGVGASVDETIGLIAALGERTRKSGSEVGNAFKSITTRIFSGESRRALESLGVMTTDLAGSLRKPIDVLRDLKTKFESLSAAQRVQAATTIAGRFQFENFLVAVDSVSRAEDTVAETLNSQGEAARRAALNNQKVGSQLNSLRDSALQSVRSLNDIVPFFDGFKEAIGFVNALVSSLGGLIAKLAILLTIVKGIGKLKDLAFPAAKAVGGVLPGAAGAVGGQVARAAVRAPPTNLIGKAAESLFSVSKFQAAFQTIRAGSLGMVGALKVLGAVLIQNPIVKVLAKFAGIVAATVALDKAADILHESLGEVNKDADFVTKSMQQLDHKAVDTAKNFTQLALIMGVKGASIFTAGQLVVDAITKIVDAIKNRREFFDIETRGKKEGKSQAEISAEQAKFFATTPEGGGKEDADLFARIARTEEILRKLKTGDKQVSDAFAKVFSQVSESLKEEFAGKDIEIPVSLLKQRLNAALQEQFKDTNIAGAALIGKDLQLVFDQLNKVSTASVMGAQDLNELAASISKTAKVSKPTPIRFGFASNELQADDFTKDLRSVQAAFIDAAGAETIFRKNITDSITLRKIQGLTEIREAEAAVRDAQDVVGQAFQGLFQVLGNQVKEESERLNIGAAVAKAIQADIANAGRTGKISSGEALLGKIEKTIGSFGVSLSGISPDKFKQLITAILGAEEEASNYGRKVAQVGQAMREARLDKFLRDLDTETSTRLQASDSIRELSQSLLDFKGRIGNTRESLIQTASGFTTLADKAAKGALDPQSFLDLARATQVSDNAIIQAKVEMINLGRAATFTLKAFAERKKVLIEEAAQLGNTEREIEKKKDIDSQIRDLETEQASFVLKTRQDLVDRSRKLIEDEQREAEENLSKDAEAQKELQSAQQGVIEATDSLASAFASLVDAQVTLREAIADFKVGLGSTAREIGIIQGRIVGFDSQINSIANIFNQILDETGITERKRLELIRESNSQQLSLVQSTIDQTKSLGERLFSSAPALGGELTTGFAAIRQIMQQFTSQGGFGKVNLNDFGNKLLSLPQQLREQISQAISFLPDTANLGGFSKGDIEKVIFGSAVGESQSADIKSIAILTQKQVDLMTNIAEADRDGIIAAQAQVASAIEGVQAAKEQLEVAKISEERAKENALLVRDEIVNSASTISSATLAAGAQVASNVSSLTSLTNTRVALENSQHSEVAGFLTRLDTNTADISNTLKQTLQQIIELGSIEGRALPVAPEIPGGEEFESGFKGRIPNFALGRKGIGNLIEAYNKEKRHGPPGANPVIANDSELIIPTRSQGNIKNFQGGNNVLNTTLIEKLLAELVSEFKASQKPDSPQEAAAKVNAEQVAPINATININGRQEVQLTGGQDVINGITQAVNRSLGNTLKSADLEQVSKSIQQLFRVLKERNLISGFGYS